MADTLISLQNLQEFKTQQDNANNGKFVAQVAGKGLSTNDFTTELLNKLNGIADGAQVNVIEIVKVNGSPVAITDKGVNIDLTGYALKSDVTGAMKIKGSVETYANLPESPSTGDAYLVKTADAEHGVDAGEFVMWDGTAWQDMGGTVDLSAYITQAAADARYVLTANLDTAVGGLGYIKSAALAEYQKTADADAKYQTKADMADYVTTDNLKTQGQAAGLMAASDYPAATSEQIQGLFD